MYLVDTPPHALPPSIPREIIYPNLIGDIPIPVAPPEPAEPSLAPSLFQFLGDFPDFGDLPDDMFPPATSNAPQFSASQLAALEHIHGDSVTPSATPSASFFPPSTHTPSLTLPPAPAPVLSARPVAPPTAPVQPVPPPPRSIASTPSSTTSSTLSSAEIRHQEQLKQEDWQKLVNKYGDARLRRHQWEWVTKGPRANTWLPYYQYQTVNKITDVWTEWVTGLNGHLSTRELEEEWGPAWCRNKGAVKTPRSRRKKVVDLIIRLSGKRNWTTDLALRFIRDHCELGRDVNGKLRFANPRDFFEYLQKKPTAGSRTGADELFFESNSYTG